MKKVKQIPTKFNEQIADEYCSGMSEFLGLGKDIKCDIIREAYIKGIAKFLNLNLKNRNDKSTTLPHEMVVFLGKK